MAQQSKSALKIVFGAMTFGREGRQSLSIFIFYFFICKNTDNLFSGAEQARVHKIEDCSNILDVFQRYGHNEIDTARVYGGGSSEEYLGQLNWQKRGIIMDTKLSPISLVSPGSGVRAYTHSPSDLRTGIAESLKALKADKVQTVNAF